MIFRVIGVLLATVASSHAEQQQLGSAVCHLHLDQKTIRLSDHLYLTLKIEGNAPVEVDLPDPLVDSPVWRVVVYPSTSQSLGEGRERWQQMFRLSPLSSGTLRLTLAPIRFRTGSEVRDRVLRWSPQEIQVTSSIQEPDLRSVRPVWGIEPLPPEAPERRGHAIGIAILSFVLVTVTFAVLLWLRRGRRALADSPEERALRQLDKVEHDVPTAVAAELIATALRTYLQERLGQPALRQTTSELIRGLQKESRLAASHLAEIERLLRYCDLAKYADETWDESLRYDVRRGVERLITVLSELVSSGKDTRGRKNT